MSARTPLVLLGAGGTALDLLDVIQEAADAGAPFEPIGFLDDSPALQGREVGGLPVLGPLSHASALADASFVNTLGSPANYRRRAAAVEPLGLAPNRFATVVHPGAQVSRRCTIGAGTLVYPQVVIGANVRVGEQVLLMAGVVLNHDVVVGDYSILTSGVLLAGRVQIGRNCYLGTGCRIVQDTKVGDEALIGMSSTVLSDVLAGSTVVGTPARRIR